MRTRRFLQLMSQWSPPEWWVVFTIAIQNVELINSWKVLKIRSNSLTIRQTEGIIIIINSMRTNTSCRSFLFLYYWKIRGYKSENWVGLLASSKDWRSLKHNSFLESTSIYSPLQFFCSDCQQITVVD
jgi:hypothetical protein